MASISFLQLHEPEEEDVVHSDDHTHNLTLDSFSCWSHDFDNFPSPSSDPDLPHQDDDVSLPDSLIITGPDLFDCRENQVNFVIDLVHQRVEQSQVISNNIPNSDNNSNSDNNVNVISNVNDIKLIDLVSDALTESGFGVVEGNHEPDLGLRLGFAFDSMETHDSDVEICMAGPDAYGDDFFVERRVSGMSTSEAVATFNGIERYGDAIGIVGFRSDSDEDEDNSIEDGVLAIDLNSGYDYGIEDDFNGGYDVDADDDVSVNIPLRWDSLQLEDRRDVNEDFEWEEVDGRGDEREVLSAFPDADDYENSVALSVSPVIALEEATFERAAVVGALGWEVLLNANNLGVNSEVYENVEDRDESEYEMLFGQFTENENASIMRPPASKSVVEKLSTVVVTQEDVENSNSLCAVCKDEVNLGETMKQLPCSHRYHGDCIIPWLGIRNTCPVCRHELPTDDAEYERRKSLRTGGA